MFLNQHRCRRQEIEKQKVRLTALNQGCFPLAALPKGTLAFSVWFPLRGDGTVRHACWVGRRLADDSSHSVVTSEQFQRYVEPPGAGGSMTREYLGLFRIRLNLLNDTVNDFFIGASYLLQIKLQGNGSPPFPKFHLVMKCMPSSPAISTT